MVDLSAEEPPTGVSLEYPARPHDIDAAHARLRSHQASLDYINSRVDGNERRIDRIEKRMDDQSTALSELSTIARSTQAEVKLNGETSRHSAGRIDYLIKRIDEHTGDDMRAQQLQTAQLERLHRTIIRVATILGVLVAGFIAFTRDGALPDLLRGIIGG